MPAEQRKRKLAAILSADAAGYSRLHGDSLLADFASVVDADRCAAEIQKELKDRNGSCRKRPGCSYGPGSTSGMSSEEEGNIFGDGLNAAARLEASADPGSTCISQTAHVHDSVGKNVLESKLPDGRFIIKELIEMARIKGEGSIEYMYPKPKELTGI